MNPFDVGAGELGFLVLLIIIFIGPKRMSETSKDIGRWLNKFVRSDTWVALKEVSNAIVHAPNRMMREANLEDLQRELDLNGGMVIDDDTPSSVSFVTDRRAGEAVADNAILPPGRSVSFAGSPPARRDEAVIEEKKTPTKKTTPAAKKKPGAKTSTKKPAARTSPKAGRKKQTHA